MSWDKGNGSYISEFGVLEDKLLLFSKSDSFIDENCGLFSFFSKSNISRCFRYKIGDAKLLFKGRDSKSSETTVAFNTGDITLLFLISIIHNEVVTCRVKDFLIIEEMNMISPIARDTKNVPNGLVGKKKISVLGSDC